MELLRVGKFSIKMATYNEWDTIKMLKERVDGNNIFLMDKSIGQEFSFREGKMDFGKPIIKMDKCICQKNICSGL